MSDLPPAVRAEAGAALRHSLRTVASSRPWSYIEDEDWDNAVDAVTAVVVPAALDLEERAHARTSAEVSRLEAENERLREEAKQGARQIEVAHAYRAEWDTLKAEVKEVAKRNALNASSAAEFAERAETAEARVVVLTEALRGLVEINDGPISTCDVGRWHAAWDRVRVVLAAGGEKP